MSSPPHVPSHLQLHDVVAVGVGEGETLSCVSELQYAVRVLVGGRAEPRGLSEVAGGVHPDYAVCDGV